MKKARYKKKHKASSKFFRSNSAVSLRDEKRWPGGIYSRNQFIAIGSVSVILVGLIYFYFQHAKLEQKKADFYTVVEQNCRYSKQGSSVKIAFQGKRYAVKMGSRDCEKYAVGTSLPLVYHAEWDYFYRPDGLQLDTRRIVFISIVLIICCIPHRLHRSVFERFLAALDRLLHGRRKQKRTN